MNVICIVCPWSKYFSARIKVSAAILKLVFAVEIMLWTTSQPISFRHFPILLLKPLHFWVPTSCSRTSQISSIGGSYGKARGSISMPVGLKMGVSALVLSTFPLLPLFTLWTILRTSDSLVCPYSSLLHNSFGKVPLSIHLCSQFHWDDSLLVTDGLDELVTLLFWHLWLLIVRFLPLFLRFFLPLCIDPLGKWRPWAIAF